MEKIDAETIPDRYKEATATGHSINVSLWICDLVCFFKASGQTGDQFLQCMAEHWQNTEVDGLIPPMYDTNVN